MPKKRNFLSKKQLITNKTGIRAVQLADKIAALITQGLAHHQLGELEQASDYYKNILLLEPEHFDALQLLGALAMQNKAWEESLELLTKALKQKNTNANVYNNFGLVQHELQQLEGALISYDKAIGLKQDYALAYNNRGSVLHDLKQLDTALESYNKAIILQPGYVEPYYNRGLVQSELKRLPEALESYNKAIALKINYPEAYNNRGSVFEELGQLEKALANYIKATELNQNFAMAYVNQGIVLKELKQIEASLACYEKAIHLKPDFPEAFWNQSLTLLLKGDLERGFSLYESGWHTKQRGIQRAFTKPLWLGKDSLVNKTILLYSEQGLGDTLQFCRYASLVAKLGAQVILEVQKPLKNVLFTLPGIHQLIVEGEELPAFDYQCPLMSLPLAFKTTLETIPNQVPYLFADPDKDRYWQDKLGTTHKLKVGLVWSGGFRPNQPAIWAVNERRNLPFHHWSALKDVDVFFYSLQKGDPAESEFKQIMQLEWNGPLIIDYTAELHDFADTAALINNLDLIISVDTSTAHLAAAMGKPVWLLSRFDGCWRWLLNRDDSPWYPSIRLFRQREPGNWNEVIQKIRAQLRQKDFLVK
jgi:hypothetical protein